jgi:hypothetical protein
VEKFVLATRVEIRSMPMHPSSRLFGCIVLCANLLLPSCGTHKTNPDSGPSDAAIDGDLDPCEEVAPAWNSIWKAGKENTPLTGTTPDTNLMDVWGSRADDIYAVGFKGTILHFDGHQWTSMLSGTEADLTGVWGYVLRDNQDQIQRTDIFAVGSSGTILRFDGNLWLIQRVINDPDPAHPNPQPVTDTLHDVWGLPAPGSNPLTDAPTVYAVGGEGLIVRYEANLNEFREQRQQVSFQDSDGVVHITYQRWSPERLGGVFGTAANDFVAVGNNGSILEYDGSGWTPQTVGVGAFVAHLNGVWGRGAGEVFAVGLDGTVVLRSGGSWQRLDLGTPQVYLRSVWAFGQTKCGEIPDGGTEPSDTSWVIFTGWNGTILLAHDGLVCPMTDVTANRIEGVWGTRPRSETDRTLPDGGIVCDPVEVLVTGVNGTLIRMSNEKGQ